MTSKKVRDQILQAAGHSCFYCKESADRVGLKVPQSRYGEDDLSNLHALCRRCLGKKGTLTDDEFQRGVEQGSIQDDLRRALATSIAHYNVTRRTVQNDVKEGRCSAEEAREFLKELKDSHKALYRIQVRRAYHRTGKLCLFDFDAAKHPAREEIFILAVQDRTFEQKLKPDADLLLVLDRRDKVGMRAFRRTHRKIDEYTAFNADSHYIILPSSGVGWSIGTDVEDCLTPLSKQQIWVVVVAEGGFSCFQHTLAPETVTRLHPPPKPPTRKEAMAQVREAYESGQGWTGLHWDLQLERAELVECGYSDAKIEEEFATVCHDGTRYYSVTMDEDITSAKADLEAQKELIGGNLADAKLLRMAAGRIRELEGDAAQANAQARHALEAAKRSDWNEAINQAAEAVKLDAKHGGEANYWGEFLSAILEAAAVFNKTWKHTDHFDWESALD